jgi:hypothetical protein
MTATECPSCHTTAARPHTDYCQDRYRGEPVSNAEAVRLRNKETGKTVLAIQYDGLNASELIDWVSPMQYVGGHDRLWLNPWHCPSFFLDRFDWLARSAAEPEWKRIAFKDLDAEFETVEETP